MTGEESRRRVHELRAALGCRGRRHGHVPRGRASARCARRGRVAAAAPARLRPRPAAARTRSSSWWTAHSPRRCARLGGEGVQSLLLEGGPTLATAFLGAELVDKLLVFVAPVLAGGGPHAFGELADRPLHRLRAERVGEDVLLEAYLREPRPKR